MPKAKEYKSTTIPGATFALYEVGRLLRNQIEVLPEMANALYRLSLNAQQQFAIMRDPEGKFKFRTVLTDEEAADFLKEHPEGASATLLTDEENNKLLSLNLEAETITESVRLTITKARLQSYKIPGEEFAGLKTVDDLLNSAEAEVFALEIENAAYADWSLAEKIRKNSASLISSEPAGAGQMSDLTATTAKSVENTQPAAAA
jgi:hypothetical protein